MHPYLWVVTSFYNPSKSKFRTANFQQFRRNLGANLAVVELSFDGQFELTDSDAEILIQIGRGSKVWQKERLLNIAIEALPAEVKEVAWIDADVIFEDDEWTDKVYSALQSFTLVQCFSEVINLPANHISGDPIIQNSDNTRKSIAYLASINKAAASSLERNSIGTGIVSRGFAWAAIRSFIQKHQLYDACVTGSGDRALAFAALNQIPVTLDSLSMNTARANHYVNWASSFHQDLAGSMSYVPGKIFHLWHGNMEDRGYKTRHQSFAKFSFDPAKDIIKNAEGAWELCHPTPEMLEYFEHFFSSRKENVADLS